MTPDSAIRMAILLEAANAFSDCLMKFTLYLYDCVTEQSKTSTYSELLGMSIFFSFLNYFELNQERTLEKTTTNEMNWIKDKRKGKEKKRKERKRVYVRVADEAVGAESNELSVVRDQYFDDVIRRLDLDQRLPETLRLHDDLIQNFVKIELEIHQRICLERSHIALGDYAVLFEQQRQRMTVAFVQDLQSGRDSRGGGRRRRAEYVQAFNEHG